MSAHSRSLSGNSIDIRDIKARNARHSVSMEQEMHQRNHVVSSSNPVVPPHSDAVSVEGKDDIVYEKEEVPREEAEEDTCEVALPPLHTLNPLRDLGKVAAVVKEVGDSKVTPVTSMHEEHNIHDGEGSFQYIPPEAMPAGGPTSVPVDGNDDSMKRPKRSHSFLLSMKQGKKGGNKGADSEEEDDIMYDEVEEVKLTSELQSSQEKAWYIIRPGTYMKNSWDILIYIVLVYSIFAVPYKLAFLLISDYSEIDIVVDLLFAADILLTFVTAYFHEGEIIYDIRKIANNYICGWFFIDFIATFPMQLLIPEDTSSNGNLSSFNTVSRIGRLPRIVKVTRMLRFLRVVRLAKIDHYMSNSFELHLSIKNQYMRLMKFVMWVTVLLHIISCAWFMIAVFDDFNTDTWVFRRHCEDIQHLYPCVSEWQCTDDEEALQSELCATRAYDQGSQMYLDGLYFGFTTMATIGYGDINAFTQNERITCIIIMLTAVSFYSFTISTLSSILAATEQEERSLQTKLTYLNEVSKFHKLPKELYHRLHKHLKYDSGAARRGGITQLQEEELMGSLTSVLRTEVLYYIHREVIAGIRLLREEDRSFAANVAAQLQVLKIEKGSYIFKENDHAGEMYFIFSGSADMLLKKIIVASIPQGGYTGVQALYRQSHGFSARARVNCTLYSWRRNDMLTLFEDYPLIYERLVKIARERSEKFRQIYSELSVKTRRVNVLNLQLDDLKGLESGERGDMHERRGSNPDETPSETSPSQDQPSASSLHLKKSLKSRILSMTSLGLTKALAGGHHDEKGEVSPSRDRTSSLPPPVSSLTLLGSHPPRSIPEDKEEEEVHERREDTHQFSGSKLSRERSSLTRDESLRGLNLFSPPVTNNIDESSSNSTFFPAPQIPHTPSHREQVAQSQVNVQLVKVMDTILNKMNNLDSQVESSMRLLLKLSNKLDVLEGRLNSSGSSGGASMLMKGGHSITRGKSSIIQSTYSRRGSNVMSQNMESEREILEDDEYDEVSGEGGGVSSDEVAGNNVREVDMPEGEERKGE